MKTLSRKEFAFLSRIAKNVEGPKNRIETIKKKMSELQAQIDEQQALIDAFEVGSVAITGGYTSSQLLEKKTVPAIDDDGKQKVGKDGTPMTTTKYFAKKGWLEEVDGVYTIVAEANCEQPCEHVEESKVEED